MRGQVGVHYPQARIREITSERDHLRLGEDERAWSLTLRASGPEYAPLRVFRDQDLVDPGSDPLLAPLGALSGLKEGERLVSRLLLRSLGPGWSRHYQEKALPGHLQNQPKPGAPPPAGSGPDPLALTVLGLAAFGFFQGYRWLQAGEIWNLAALCAGAAVVLLGGGWAWRRWKKSRDRYFDPQLVKEKISRGAFEAELELVAVLPSGSQEERAQELLERLAAAYRHYDHPSGPASRRARFSRISRGRRACIPDLRGCSAGAASWACARRRRSGIRPARPMSRRSWPAPAPAACRPRWASWPAAPRWGRPVRPTANRSTSPRTSWAATSSTWPARGWASRP